jgi:hypothetical protein
MIVLLPLEPLEIRYTRDWAVQFPREMDKMNIDYKVVNGEPLTTKIELGSVLDAYGTNFWKASQMCELIRLMHNGTVRSSDTLLFADLWSPGIEALRYIANMGGARPAITGVLHAGTWDENDFLVRQGLRPYFRPIEDAWFNMFDKVFLGSQYHKYLILDNHKVDEDKLVVTGLPFYPKDFCRKEILRYDNSVIFPHRLDREKHPEQFDALMKRHPELKGIKTAEHFTTKDAYYDELASASIAISCATQETFGYAMLEATALGCIPLVPNRLSYKELYPEIFRYNNLFELEDKMLDVLQNRGKYEKPLKDLVIWLYTV